MTTTMSPTVTRILLLLLFTGTVLSIDIDCSSMAPVSTSIIPQSEACPFKIHVSSKFYKPNVALTVTVSSIDGSKFQDLQIVARKLSGNDNGPQGTFLGAEREVMIQNCKEVSGDGYVKINNKLLSNITFFWSADKYVGHIYFLFTISRDYQTFWIRERSATVLDHTKDLPVPKVPQENIVPLTKQINTADCGKTRGCYREPAGCWELNCKYIVTWKSIDNVVEVEMSMATGRIHNVWMTFALSDDTYEGDDYAFDCIEDFKHGVVSVSLSYIRGVNDIVELDEPKKGIVFETGSHYNNRLRCLFRIQKSAGNKHDYMLKEGKWHVLLGGGKAWDGKKTEHGLGIGRVPIVSVEEVDMSETDDISGISRYPIAKTHVILMILAWIVCAPIGCLMSMYYKRMWPNSRFLEKRYWFVVYWPCMVSVFVLMILAFIFFFVDAGGYVEAPYLPLRAHPIMLIVVFVCVLIIPIIMLLIRCTDGCLQFIFNIICFILCLVTLILAIPTLLISLDYGRYYIPWWITWFLVAIMIIQLIIDILLKIHDFCYYEKNEERREKYEYSKRENPKLYIPEPHPVGRRFKKCCLFVHVFFTVVLSVIVIIVIAAA
ncbi:putative ferric-chelate reductase 1 [Octopus sinensis]|uniref:Ferric-chelate reductase 1 n=1 Tax=Octopus sinensis TaxID=2607531 RepID=A0A6P7STG8_9MOLL|nr:putative ferric-chelate reductase 1 [Octopus sinensis]XP_029641558.1 putative ferric-chelate reductase 1 [Octopus sinensis]XP_036362483.1 putative ferric-chelate reductase 1 [Octopus sinensis]